MHLTAICNTICWEMSTTGTLELVYGTVLFLLDAFIPLASTNVHDERTRLKGKVLSSSLNHIP